MHKITKISLERVAEMINRQMKTPEETYAPDPTGVLRAQVGNYHISYAYGGACLHQISNEGGAARDVLFSGHIPKRDLFNLMHAFLRGIEEVRK